MQKKHGAASHDAGEGTAVDQQALTGDIAGLCRAQEGAGRAELRRISEALRRDCLLAGAAHLRRFAPALFRRVRNQRSDPVGIELYAAGHYDQRTLKNDWNATNTDPGIGPDPARLEEFNLRRAGGMALARVRLTWQSTKVRVGVTAGAGVSYRLMYVDRLTTAKDGSGLRDAFVSDVRLPL